MKVTTLLPLQLIVPCMHFLKLPIAVVYSWLWMLTLIVVPNAWDVSFTTTMMRLLLGAIPFCVSHLETTWRLSSRRLKRVIGAPHMHCSSTDNEMMLMPPHPPIFQYAQGIPQALYHLMNFVLILVLIMRMNRLCFNFLQFRVIRCRLPSHHPILTVASQKHFFKQFAWWVKLPKTCLISLTITMTSKTLHHGSKIYTTSGIWEQPSDPAVWSDWLGLRHGSRTTSVWPGASIQEWWCSRVTFIHGKTNCDGCGGISFSMVHPSRFTSSFLSQRTVRLKRWVNSFLFKGLLPISAQWWCRFTIAITMAGVPTHTLLCSAVGRPFNLLAPWFRPLRTVRLTNHSTDVSYGLVIAILQMMNAFHFGMVMHCVSIFSVELMNVQLLCYHMLKHINHGPQTLLECLLICTLPLPLVTSLHLALPTGLLNSFRFFLRKRRLREKMRDLLRTFKLGFCMGPISCVVRSLERFVLVWILMHGSARFLVPGEIELINAFLWICFGFSTARQCPMASAPWTRDCCPRTTAWPGCDDVVRRSQSLWTRWTATGCYAYWELHVHAWCHPTFSCSTSFAILSLACEKRWASLSTTRSTEVMEWKSCCDWNHDSWKCTKAFICTWWSWRTQHVATFSSTPGNATKSPWSIGWPWSYRLDTCACTCSFAALRTFDATCMDSGRLSQVGLSIPPASWSSPLCTFVWLVRR